MATFTITPDKSVFGTAADTPAFSDDTGSADALIVQAGAYLISTGASAADGNAAGAFLANTGAWTVTVNGVIVSENDVGVFLEAGNTTSSIAVSEDGEIGGSDIGIFAGSAVNINNKGLIGNLEANVGDAAIILNNNGTNTIVNSGTVAALTGIAIEDRGSSNDSLTNSGTIDGDVNLGEGNDKVINSGDIVDDGGSGAVDLGDDNNTLSNTSTGAMGALSGGSGNDVAINAGAITGKVDLNGGNNNLTNSGTITGDVVVGAGGGNDILNNSGKITGSVDVGEGNNTLTNTATGSIGTTVTAGDGNDVLTNASTIGGAVDLGGGNNKITNSDEIIGTVDLGSGNDTISNSGDITDAVDLGDGNNFLTVTNTGFVGGASVTGGSGADIITNAGEIDGDITLGAGNNKIANSSKIGGAITLLGGNDVVTNSKLITGDVDLGDGTNTLTNSAKSEMGAVTGGVGNDSVSNLGTIHGAVALDKGIDKLTNSGTIDGDATLGEDADTVTNTNLIEGVVDLGAGNNTLNNSGKNGIGDGDDGVVALGGNDTVTSSALIDGDVVLGDGDNKLTSSAKIDGLVLLGGGNDTVAISGEVTGTVTLGEGNNTLNLTSTGRTDALTAGGGNDSVTNAGTIGGDVELGGNTNKLTNSGVIEGVVTLGGGTDTVTNSGRIEGELDLGAGANTLTNSIAGVIGDETDGVTGGGDADIVTNAGDILGDVNLGAGDNKITNSGTSIDGDVILLGGNDTVTNTGTITGDVDLGDGVNILNNTGSKAIIDKLTGGSGADTVTNSGTIEGAVDLKNGSNKLTNTGLIDDSVTLGTGADTMTISGVGKVTGTIELGTGNDNLTGSNQVETVNDNDGGDTYNLGGGNDKFVAAHLAAADGNDVVDAGAGTDTYDAEAADDAVFINLDNVSHSDAGTDIKANTAYGLDVSTKATDAIRDGVTNFENATTGDGDDIIYGTAGNNVLTAGDGTNQLYGFGGNDDLFGGKDTDTLVGGTGNDILMGDDGADLLTGGTGHDDLFGNGDTAGGPGDKAVDQYIFTLLGDSGLTAATRDTIWDYEDGTDLIVINAIDGNATGGATDDPFEFIGVDVKFSTTPGELRVVTSASGWIIEGNNDTDTAAEFSISVYDPTHVLTWDIDNFRGLVLVLEADATTTFDGAQLTGSNIVVNELKEGAGATTLEINVASGDTNDFSGLTFKAVTGGNAFDDGQDIVKINGAAGEEDITGTIIADVISGGDGADTLAGGKGNDTYTYASTSEAAAGENIVEATNEGIDTIRTTATADLSALTVNGSADLEGAGTNQGIEQILIEADTTATFSGAQLTGNTIAVNESDDGTAGLVINVASGETNTFANLTFTGITTAGFTVGEDFDDGGDTVTINGAAGTESITGTTIADVISGGDDADTLTGGTGDDTYTYAATSEAAAGENIVEASSQGTDTLRTTATADLSAVKVNGSADLEGAGTNQGIEQILIEADTTATFSGAQLTGNTIAVNESAAGATELEINVAKDATNSFASLTFAQFTGGNAFDDGGDLVTIDGADGDESITGTTIADVISGGDGADTLIGGTGNDTYSYAATSEAAATEDISEGTDQGSADTLRTTATADLSNLTVNGSADLEGSSKDQGIEQILIAANTTATFSGAQLDGNTIAVNESATGTTTLVINVAKDATVSFVNLTFGAFSGGDAFDSGQDSVTINGTDGDENITGTGIADTISGGDGADALTGGAGNDTYSYATTAEAATDENIVENTSGGTDTLRTTAAADLSELKVNSSADLQGASSAGIEQILIEADTTATFSGTQLTGNTIAVNELKAGTTTLEINVASGASNDFSDLTFAAFTGGNAFDDGQDIVTINGAAGSEIIVATDIADRLVAGAGSDTLTGGTGNDTFIYQVGDGADTIIDFIEGSGTDDRIDVTDFGAAFDTLAEIQAAATDNGANTTIDFGGGDTLTLLNVNKGNLHDDDFIFV